MLTTGILINIINIVNDSGEIIMKFLRIKEVSEKIGVPPTTINLYRNQDKFPACVQLSEKVNVWVEDDIEKWMEQRVKDSSGK